ncbi:MAG: glycosyl hydrolase family 95 catalytic domain-containing protein, partial [Planctomycetaceae bacterium]
MLYFPLLAADAMDLTDPFFSMYVKQLPNCEHAARQRWGVAGAYFPETTAFDGPTVLPDDVAAEFQDVLLGRKTFTELSPRAKDLCQFDSQLRATTAPHKGRFSWISHVASSGSELAIHAWWRYRYTGDQEWLRTHAYPLLRGTVEFYRHLVRKEADGRYHLSGTHAHEDFWGVKDSIMDLAAIRGTAPLAIRAAEILDVDPDLRGRWKELLENLAPYPMGSDPQAKALTGGALAEDVWAA